MNINEFGKISIIVLLIVVLIFGVWFYAGWPRIWQKPPIPPEIKTAQAQGNNGAMMVYALGTNTTPRYRIWDEATDTWGTEGSATAVSGTIQFMVLRFSRTRNEGILGTLDSTGDIRTQIWNGTSWSSTTLHANIGTTNDVYRGFDIAYETNGDRAIIVFNDANSADPAYQIWDGTSWSPKTSITDPPTTGAPLWIELASNPLSTSSEIAMMLIDANADIYGMVWTGSAWSNMGVTTVWDDTGAIATKESIDVAYEQLSGRAMFIWADSVATDQYYRIWDGSSLTSNTLLDIPAMGGVGNWVRLVPRPNSNELMYGVQDAGSDLNTRKWSGSAWDTETQHPEHDDSVEQATTRTFDIVWETYPANAGKAWLVWGDGATYSRKQWSGTDWGPVTTAGDDTAIIRLEAQPNSGTVFAMIFQDSSSKNDDILEQHLVDGGTTWSALFTVWGGPVSEVTYEPFDIASMRFVAQPTFNQSAYRWRNDDGSESTASWMAAENTAITGVSTSTIIRIRIEVEETNSATGTVNARLEFSSDATGCTDGTWTALDTLTTAWRIVDSTYITNGDPTTNQLTTSARTFSAGRIFDTQNEDTTGVTLNNTHTEWEWAIRGDGAAANTTYRFRITNAGTVLNTYTNCAQLTTAIAYTVSCTTPLTSTDFGTIDNSAVYTSTPNSTITVTTNSPSGFTMKIYDTGCGSGAPGLFKSTAPTDCIGSADSAYADEATLVAGTEGFGLQATTTSPDITIAPRFNKTGNDVGGLEVGSASAVIIASSSVAVTDQVVEIIYKAAVSSSNLAGSYSDTITIQCTVN